MTSDLEQILDEREITRALIQIARAMDERDWKTIEQFIAEDIRADLGMGETTGKEPFMKLLQSFLENCGVTQHMLGSIVVNVDEAGNTASSKAYVNDMHLGKWDKKDLSFRTLGDYHDEWQKVDGVWLLSKRVKHNRATMGSFEVFETPNK